MSESRILLFEAFGVHVYGAQDRYWARYDAGELADDWVEVEISAEEVQRLKRSERDAYEVLLAHHEQRQKVRP